MVKNRDDYKRLFLQVRKELLGVLRKENLLTPQIEVEDIVDIITHHMVSKEVGS